MGLLQRRFASMANLTARGARWSSRSSSSSSEASTSSKKTMAILLATFLLGALRTMTFIFPRRSNFTLQLLALQEFVVVSGALAVRFIAYTALIAFIV